MRPLERRDGFRHVRADVRSVATTLEEPGRVEGALEQLFEAAGVAVVSRAVRVFEPQGKSLTLHGAGLTVVAHTWPERGAATVDVFSHLDAVESALARCVRLLETGD